MNLALKQKGGRCWHWGELWEGGGVGGGHRLRASCVGLWSRSELGSAPWLTAGKGTVSFRDSFQGRRRCLLILQTVPKVRIAEGKLQPQVS